MLRVCVVASLVLLCSCKKHESKPPDITPTQKPDDKAGSETSASSDALDLYGDPLPAKALGRMGSLRMVDRDIRNMVFTASGSQIISTHKGGFQIWNLTDVSRGELLAHKAPGDLLSVSPDGKYLAASNEDNTEVQLYDLATGEDSAKVKTPAPLVGMCFLDATHFAGLTSHEVVTWTLSAGAPKRVAGGWKDASAFACSESGWLGIGTEDGDAFVMKVGDDKATKLGSGEKAIHAVALSHKGTLFAFAGEDEVIRIWGQPSPEAPIEIQGHTRLVTSLAFTPDDGKIYSSGGDSWFRIWDPRTSELLEEMTGVEGLDAQLMTMSPDGALMVSWSEYANARGSEAGRWWLWNANTGAPLLEPQRHSKAVTSVEFAPDGKHLVTSGEDRSVRVWDAATYKGIAIVETEAGSVNDAHFSKDGATVFSAGVDATLRRWNWQNGDDSVVFESVGGAVNRFVISKDESRAITGDQIGRVWSWDLQTGNKIQAHDRQGYSAIYDLDLSFDGKMLAIAGSDRLVRVLDFQSGKELATINPGDTQANFAVRFSPDGRSLATGGDSHKIYLWNTEDWSQLAALPGHDGTVRALTFSPNGLRLVSGGNDEIVKVWELPSGKELARYAGHDGVINDLAVSADGKTVASASRDRTVLVWPLP